ncbi:ATP synthase subunit O, mitochondrial [Gossypium australe]|uniref:ATP synthase subunit O, mitochondrial n=1 Tax=Gossypium australe TaxID=47621 RepID=A0A5B6UZY7_9ROSI|nr:ATP synthase subunit O, mitochondrial [Gossypium australe]
MNNGDESHMKPSPAEFQVQYISPSGSNTVSLTSHAKESDLQNQQMAMASRIRSTLPLFRRLLRSDSLPFHTPRATLHRTLLCPELSRKYSTSPKKDENVKVPLALFGGSGNYASALYLAAVKGNALDKVESELLDLVQASKNSQLFSQFTKDLSVPAETRVKAINEICGQAKFSDLTKNFLGMETGK